MASSATKTNQEMDFTRTIKLAHEEGILELGSFLEHLTPLEFKSILECIASSKKSLGRDLESTENLEEGEGRPRKCRRVEGIASFLASLTNCHTPIWKLRLVGNQSVLLQCGEEHHLNLLPCTVQELDLSNCSLSNQAIRTVCRFMYSNQTITRLLLWGNPGLNENQDQGVGRAISRMLGKNNTLEYLSIIPQQGQLSVSTTVEIAFWLGKNQSLHVLHMAWDTNEALPDRSFRQQTKSSALAFGLQGNTTLEQVTFGGLPPNDELGNRRWEQLLQENETLHSVCSSAHLKDLLSQTMVHFLNLNAIQARQLMREQDESDHYTRRWMATLAKATLDANSTGVHALYYLLREDPGLWC